MDTPSDEDLLENAIPIDDADDDLIDIEEVDDAPALMEIAEAPVAAGGASKIKQFGQERKPHDEHWARTPNTTGSGAIHVKTFISKLRYDAIAHLDEQVNQWLDAHPEYEVKFVSTNIGKLVAKNTEDALFMSVWV